MFATFIKRYTKYKSLNVDTLGLTKMAICKSIRLGFAKCSILSESRVLLITGQRDVECVNSTYVYQVGSTMFCILVHRGETWQSWTHRKRSPLRVPRSKIGQGQIVHRKTRPRWRSRPRPKSRLNSTLALTVFITNLPLQTYWLLLGSPLLMDPHASQQLAGF